VTGALADTWDLQYDDTGDAFASPVLVTGITTTTYTIQPLDKDVPIDVRVRGVNGAGAGSFSTAILNTSPNQLPAPANPAASGRGTGGITFSWSAVTNATSYKVGWATVTTAGPSSNYGANLQTGLSQLSTTIQGLTPSTNYFIRAFAQGIDEGVASAEVQQTSGSAGSAEITPSVTVNGIANPTPGQISGVAPFAVHIQAYASTATGVSDTFRDLDYVWDFADPGSGNWTDHFSRWGATRSKNTYNGPVTCHVYETPGNYTILGTLQKLNGELDTVQIDVTATNPDTVFGAANTILVSNGTDFSAGPASDDKITCANTAAAWNGLVAGKIALGKRVLFKRGDSFTVDTAKTLDGSGEGIIGTFGSGARPIINQSNASASMLRMDEGKWRLVDLDLRHASLTTNPPTVEWVIDTTTTFRRDQLMLRLSFATLQARPFDLSWSLVNFYAGTDQTLSENITPNGVAIVDCDLSGMNRHGLVGAKSFAYMGNKLDVEAAGNVFEHTWRSQYLENAIFAYNHMTGGNISREIASFRGPSSGTGTKIGSGDGMRSHHFSVSDNVFLNRNGNGGNVNFKAQNTSSYEWMEFFLCERNLNIVESGPQIFSNAISIEIGRKGTARNNCIILNDNISEVGISVSYGAGVSTPSTDDIHVLNNSVHEATGGAGWAVRVLGSAGTGILVANNAIKGTLGAAVDNQNGVDTTLTTNHITAGTIGWVSETPATMADFGLTAGATSLIDINTNFAAVQRDAVGALRAATDIGAFEKV
jgi:hypothetical protein